MNDQFNGDPRGALLARLDTVLQELSLDTILAVTLYAEKLAARHVEANKRIARRDAKQLRS